MRVGLVFGGRSVEHVISLRSARTVRDGLAAAGHEVIALGITETGAWLPPGPSAEALTSGQAKLPASSEAPRQSLRHLLEANIDVAFPIVHGTYGEDGTLQGLLEMLDVPYVGCGVAASAVAMDKRLAKQAFVAAGLPVVPWVAVDRRSFAQDAEGSLAAAAPLGLPAFVKPSVGGSSVGCGKAKDAAALHEAVRFALRFDDVALIERAVTAREVEVAVMGPARALRTSAIGEIVPGGDFYDYEDKYLKDAAQLIAPAVLPDAIAQELRALAVRAMDAIGGAGIARVDFFLVGEQLYLNEINTLPGFTSASMVPRLWALSGVPLPQLCDGLVQLALEARAARRRLDEGVKAFVG